MTNRLGGCRTRKFTEDNHSRLNINLGILSANILSKCGTAALLFHFPLKRCPIDHTADCLLQKYKMLFNCFSSLYSLDKQNGTIQIYTDKR